MPAGPGQPLRAGTARQGLAVDAPLHAAALGLEAHALTIRRDVGVEREDRAVRRRRDARRRLRRRRFGRDREQGLLGAGDEPLAACRLERIAEAHLRLQQAGRRCRRAGSVPLRCRNAIVCAQTGAAPLVPLTSHIGAPLALPTHTPTV